MTIRANANANLNSGAAQLTGSLFGKKRTYIDEEYSTDQSVSFPYYAKTKKLKRIRFRVAGVVPVFLQPSVTTKLDGRASFMLQSIENGGIARMNFQPLFGQAIVKLDVAAGGKRVNAGVRGQITAFTAESNIVQTLAATGDLFGNASLKAEGYLLGPEGKISIFARIRKKEKQRDLWSFRTPFYQKLN